MADAKERLSAHFTLAEMIESGAARRDPELWRQQCSPPADVEGAMRRLAVATLEPLRNLFAVAATLLDALQVDQVIHEHGDRFGAPAWVHISHGPRRRRRILAIGDWTGGSYRSYASLDGVVGDRRQTP